MILQKQPLGICFTDSIISISKLLIHFLLHRSFLCILILLIAVHLPVHLLLLLLMLPKLGMENMFAVSKWLVNLAYSMCICGGSLNID